MYGWIWHRLPGPRWVRAGCAIVLVAAVVAALWFGVFPRVESLLPVDNVTISQ